MSDFRSGDFRSGDVLRDHHGRIIGRARDQAEHRVADRNGRARLQAELGRRLARGELRDLELGIEREPAALQFAEQQIEGHHLGERGGMAQAVGVAGVENLAGLGIDDDRRLGCRFGCARCCRRKGAGNHNRSTQTAGRPSEKAADRAQSLQHVDQYLPSRDADALASAVPAT